MKWLVDYKPEFRSDICIRYKGELFVNKKEAGKIMEIDKDFKLDENGVLYKIFEKHYPYGTPIEEICKDMKKAGDDTVNWLNEKLKFSKELDKMIEEIALLIKNKILEKE